MLHKLKNISLTILKKIGNVQAWPSVQPIFWKALTFTLFFLILEVEQFPVLLVIIFVIVAFILYAKPLFKTRSLLVSFVVLIPLSLLVASRFAISFEPAGLPTTISFSAWAFALLFGLLFYIMLGIKYLVFIRRKEAYHFLHLALFYLAFVLYFSATPTHIASVIGHSLIMIIFTLLMLREFFSIVSITDQSQANTARIARWVLVLLILQALWVINLLPIEFSNAASLATLFAFIIIEITRRYFENGLSARFLRWNFLVFITLTGLIFLTSQWTL
ncbi:MAG: hypothetical protein COU11_04025 [Candidatus Harrisonbacteria bacterium CG10_big_fil_rev_8_21_14_0_10_49_15]|uniref:Uncharacterized protein n=1 Tax=Candidatus Harrisonbacteria bacterium CG10_big_fil_rev_8_21_14_0_10_49_15 TaxID=1974587 RepID=A0A2H0UJS3_9BACT|nr:MAG: hypothetical protein COU11_04025 [Candidatus Harrisonbacteria bacterium CG10_big_fil_rev_8_21_14_0_10_49_15]